MIRVERNQQDYNGIVEYYQAEAKINRIKKHGMEGQPITSPAEADAVVEHALMVADEFEEIATKYHAQGEIKGFIRWIFDGMSARGWDIRAT